MYYIMKVIPLYFRKCYFDFIIQEKKIPNVCSSLLFTASSVITSIVKLLAFHKTSAIPYYSFILIVPISHYLKYGWGGMGIQEAVRWRMVSLSFNPEVL